MRHKKTLLVLALSLFVLPLTNAYADDFYLVQLNSVRNVYDPSYFSVADQYAMLTAAGTQSDSSRVFVQFNPIGDKSQISTYLPQWSALLPPWNLYVLSVPKTSTYNFDYYETNNAFFFIDLNNNSVFDSGEKNREILYRSAGTYNFLDGAKITQITGGIYPTITWDSVQGAENYRFGIAGLTASGLPDINDLKFIKSGVTSPYTYDGSPLQYGQSYAFFIEARDFGDGNPAPETLVNQSRYFTEYTTPIPEPSTMLLLGSGLIGLVGYGRKKFLKK
jgi:hypothetical protein